MERVFHSPLIEWPGLLSSNDLLVANEEWKELAFGLYSLYQSTGAPSFAFFAKGGIVRSRPAPPTTSGRVPKQTWFLSQMGPIRNTHSKSGGGSFICRHGKDQNRPCPDCRARKGIVKSGVDENSEYTDPPDRTKRGLYRPKSQREHR